MAKYVSDFDLSDPSLVITELHCEEATPLVEAALWVRRINPNEVAFPNDILIKLAGYWAKRAAAIEGAMGDDSPLLDKARKFREDALMLEKSLSRESLGIAGGSPFGSVTLGRG